MLFGCNRWDCINGGKSSHAYRKPSLLVAFTNDKAMRRYLILQVRQESASWRKCKIKQAQAQNAPSRIVGARQCTWEAQQTSFVATPYEIFDLIGQLATLPTCQPPIVHCTYWFVDPKWFMSKLYDSHARLLRISGYRKGLHVLDLQENEGLVLLQRGTCNSVSDMMHKTVCLSCVSPYMLGIRRTMLTIQWIA